MNRLWRDGVIRTLCPVLATAVVLAGVGVRGASAETTLKVASFNIHGPVFTPDMVGPAATSPR